MAEFKLERFKYNWEGDWSAARNYNRDDVVRYGGKSYVCLGTHTSSANFYTDLDRILPGSVPPQPEPRWAVMTSGKSFVGTWAPTTFYNIGDIVLHTGSLWKCLNAHTSAGFEDNESDWELFALGSSFEAEWQGNTNYGPGALVSYGSIVYRCIAPHTSQTFLEDNADAWETFLSGRRYAGAWTSETTYRKDDYVRYGGSIFECTESHASSFGFDDTKFRLLFPGFQFSGEWNDTTTYETGDIVRYGGYLYYALANNFDLQPSLLDTSDSTTYWSLMQQSYNLRGDWSGTADYYTGDIVRRGGMLYICRVDVVGDGSTLDYDDDDLYWETLVPGKIWKAEWTENTEYAIGDVVNFFGELWTCKEQHLSQSNTYPGDNGSGYDYFDFLAQSGEEGGLRFRGDLLTYDYKNRLKNDLSTLGSASVPVTKFRDVLSILTEDQVSFRTYMPNEELVIYVAQEGVDLPGRGLSPLIPFKTIRYACEYIEDNIPIDQPKKVRVATGTFSETLPIIVPAKTVVMGDELRSTTITANTALEGWNNDQLTGITGGINRIIEILDDLFTNAQVEKTSGNNEDQVIVNGIEGGTLNTAYVTALNSDLVSNIEYNLGIGGFQPDITGTNTISTDQLSLNAATILDNNRQFLIMEAWAYSLETYPQFTFDADWFIMAFNSFIRGFAYDLRYQGNYQTVLAGRRFANSINGSQLEDMFYMRDITGLRQCTTKGLEGSLNPPGVFDIYQLPTGGAFCSLDPGWGPDDERCWIKTRSPYIQGVTTIGKNCIGQKVDGSLHNGGNKSFTSNDFTQVLSDGIGAWILNNGRAELVSVFTYYCAIGYFAEDGGVIRATNGNNSYGKYGSVADGIDDTEPEKFTTISTRENEAVVAFAFAGEVTDKILAFEYSHCGENYTAEQTSVDIIGSGNFVDVDFDDTRDGGLFQARLIPPPDSGSIGGSGFLTRGGNAQFTADATSTIILDTGDPTELEATYLGMRIVIVSGDGTGQYGYITAYNPISKLASVAKESTGEAGWDHIVPGEDLTPNFSTNTQYKIEPRMIVADPGLEVQSREFTNTREWRDIVYGDITQVFENLTAPEGTGTFADDIGESAARFTVTKFGKTYDVNMLFAGTGYAVGDELVIQGTDLGGDSPANDLTITVTTNTDDSSNSIVNFTTSGLGKSGRWVAVSNSNLAAFSDDGENWSERIMPYDANWNKVENGSNVYIAITAGIESGSIARSLDGESWTQRNLPVTLTWADIKHDGDETFAMIAEGDNRIAYSTNRGLTWGLTAIPDSTGGDSTENQWQSLCHGRGQFLAVSGSTNSVATSEDGVTWTLKENVLPAGDYDWVSVAYGRGRYVAISRNNNASAISLDDGTTWKLFSMPSDDGSTAMEWKDLDYFNGLFFAVYNNEGVEIAADEVTGETYFFYTSEDGINWKARDTQIYKKWEGVGYGYKNDRPTYVLLPQNDFIIAYAYTGAGPKLRASLNGGIFNDVRIWDPGSGYTAENLPEIIVYDTQYVLELTTENRIGNGVLAQPTFLNRGIGYRTSSTQVKIIGDGFADIIPAANQIVLEGLDVYPGPGVQLLIDGLLDEETEDPNDQAIYIGIIITPLGSDGNGKLKAKVQISPSLKVTDNVRHGTNVRLRERYSQCRISGHDFLDIGTGNFEDTNYPAIYAGGAYFISAPENEVYEINGGRVFYTSTDQSGNFRAGELFSVEQATGVVTISAEYFDLDGLSELALGGVRLGGSGTVIREFSTDPNFTEDSNNVIPTQRAIATFLANRLSEGGSEIQTNSLIAGSVQVGTTDNIIDTTFDTYLRLPVTVKIDGDEAHIQGQMLANMMFHRSWNGD